MVLHSSDQPLQREERPIPVPDTQQLLIKIQAFGVCRTDLHLVDGELPPGGSPPGGQAR